MISQVRDGWIVYCDKTAACRKLGPTMPMDKQKAQIISDKHDRLKHS